MKLLSFLKGAGAKVLKKPVAKKEIDQNELIRQHVRKYGFLVEDLNFSLGGEKLTLSGKVDTIEIKNKIIVAAGNIEGISEVEDLMVVNNLAENARMPMPKVYMINQNQPNTFTTCRNPQNGVVAVTQGLGKQYKRERNFGSPHP